MIVHVIHSLCYGGIETGVVRISNNQVIKESVTIVIVASSPDLSLASELNPSIRLINIKLPRSFKTLGRAVRQLSKLINRMNSPVFIHLHLNLLNWIYVLIIRLFCSFKVRIYSHSYTTHNILGNGLRGTIMMAVNRLSTVFVDGRIADSAESASYVYGKKPKVNIINMPPGVMNADLAKYFTNNLSWSKKIVLGNIGRLSPVKNQEVLIEVLSYLVLAGKEVELRLIGSGKLYDTLRQQAFALGVQERVTIISPQSDIVKAFEGIDIFLFPSLSESLPGTLIEAQLLGIRCISNSNINHRAIVNNELFTGVKDIQDIDEWTKLIYLEVGRKISKEVVLRSFQGDFFMDKVMGKYERLYVQ